MKRTDADRQKIIEQLKAAAKPIPLDGDRLYVRATDARRIIGVSWSHAAGWVTRGRITPLRFKVAKSPTAPFGRASIWPLDQTINCAKGYVPFWTDDEDDYIINNLGKKSTEQIAAKLGRTNRAVQHRAGHLGITKYDAQNLLTTGVVAGLCRRTHQGVSHWCLKMNPPLRHTRLTFGKREKMIHPKDLLAFLDAHPSIKASLPDSALRTLERMTASSSTPINKTGTRKLEDSPRVYKTTGIGRGVTA